MRTYSTILALITAGVLLGACGSDNGAYQDDRPPAQSATEAPAHTTYDVRGRIVEIRNDGTRLLVDHEEIPGYMAAMTMPFDVRDVNEVEGLAAGDAVTFVYHVTPDGMWITDVAVVNSDAVSTSPSADAEPEYDDPAEGSVYWLDDAWTTQRNASVRLADFEGKPVVMAMVFTHCGYACPMIVRDMKRVGARLPADQNEDVQYVLVSLDPDRDTPEQMQRFASAHRLDPDQWTMLRGTKSQVRMLAAALGIRYRQESDGQFAHSNLVTILDASGEIALQQRGLEVDGVAASETITRLLASR
jgi:protein SCO1